MLRTVKHWAVTDPVAALTRWGGQRGGLGGRLRAGFLEELTSELSGQKDQQGFSERACGTSSNTAGGLLLFLGQSALLTVSLGWCTDR